eukprot:CAMPEP_0114362052 /NCGR_PEP_ID=MMETSP0101-20121206/25304_1 /TAXON_ID=38822 ORGANISM="Pteridomonas danica, Strain PT" /NCGR_SAMPLE_ID=MMETSP0101 /ASSEMBLY_ACC=CAM_ASM_000211 /LENGTH=579 /DNA_ID=CAMNT_0001507555 /DNA_START=1 /DNA_END=1736 /DNA_ORIENTATION=-
MTDFLEISTLEVESAMRLLGFLSQNDRTCFDLRISDQTDQTQSQILLKKLKREVDSLHYEFLKKHREKVRDRKLGPLRKCGLVQDRVGRLAHSGMMTKAIQGATPLLIEEKHSEEILTSLTGNSNKDNLEKVSTSENMIEGHAAELSQKPMIQLRSEKFCYVCKSGFDIAHHFYDQLCPLCGDINYSKRIQTVNLNGKFALVTGGRVKIGYHIALKLLRAGCHVIITTRFPNDAAARYSLESDYNEWNQRLKIYGVDFRSIKMVEAFSTYICETHSQLDILINNAAQTIARPPAYYAHLLDKEFSSGTQWPTVCHFASTQVMKDDKTQPSLNNHDDLVNDIVSANTDTDTKQQSIGAISALASQVQIGDNVPDSAVVGMSNDGVVLNNFKVSAYDAHFFPVGKYDVDGQQIDERKSNTWTSTLHDVSSCELLEVLAVNSAAPFILMKMLKPIMTKTCDDEWSFIVNVSSMEGSFNHNKTFNHPHTNGAKAFLDMITRTSASDYALSNIYMNSVDTGWVTNEKPRPHRSSFMPPIDEIDGAARVLDPLYCSVASNTFVFGQYYKDYVLCDVGLKQRATES